MTLSKILAAVAVTLGFISTSYAAPASYPTPGTVNPASYSFFAAGTGNVVAYFAGSDAGYTSTLSLLVNGVDTGITGLNNKTSAYGDALNFGSFNIGDELVFRLNVATTGAQWFSKTSLNADGQQHIFADAYAGDVSIPVGTYIGFEDISGGGDMDYNDHQFVFTNVRGPNNNPLPLPATPLLVGLGFAAMALAAKRRKQA